MTLLRHYQTEGATSSQVTGATDKVAGFSQDSQGQLCADKAHGGAVLLAPLAREAGSQMVEEVLSFSLYYPISGDDERREVSAALPARLRMLRLLLLCKAIQKSSDWAVGIRLGVSVANTEFKQRLSLWMPNTPHRQITH